MTIYLDNNATTAIDSSVANRLAELYAQSPANPASQHVAGREALRLLEGAKSELLELLDAPRTGMHSASVILTSGGTEANNLAVLGRAAERTGKILFAATEHPSVPEAALRAEQTIDGCSAKSLPVRSNGLLDIDALRLTLQEHGASVTLLSVMLGNNETGVIQNLAEICELCKQYDVPVHSDVVQAVGKIPFSMQELGLAAVSLTAHKIHGPVGIGALVVNPGFQVRPMLFGGGQQLGIRPGTEPVIPAVALAKSVQRTIDARNEGTYDQICKMRDQFETRLRSEVPCTIIAEDAPRLPHTSNVAFHGKDRQALQMALDLAGIACSTGSACSSGSSRPSPVLTAMSIEDEIAIGSLRFSFSKYTNAAEVDAAVEQIIATVRQVPDRSEAPAWSKG